MKNSQNSENKNMQGEYEPMTLEKALLKKKRKKTTKTQHFYSFRKIQININSYIKLAATLYIKS